MARREPRFQVTVDLDRTVNSNKCQHFSQTGFLLHIRTFLEDDNGNVRDDYPQEEFQEDYVLPEFVFGSDRHRNRVAHRFREAGWRDQGSLERILDLAFSDAISILDKEKEKKKKNQKKNNHGFEGIPTIILRVKKFLSWEDESEAMGRALELSMQEAPKPVPATKESIQALQKVQLEFEGDLDCMICMEKLKSPGTEIVTCMPCSHLFHGDCIEKWLNTSHHCPLCRFPLPTDAARI